MYIQKCVDLGHREGDPEFPEAWCLVRRSRGGLWGWKRAGLAGSCPILNKSQLQAAGASLSGRILLIVYARRKTHETHTIRIISATQANRKERQAYAHLGNQSSPKRTRWLNCRGKSVRRFVVTLKKARLRRSSAFTMSARKLSPYEASRDLSGSDLAQALRKLGYSITRQAGSHLRLTTSEPGGHHLTIP